MRRALRWAAGGLLAVGVAGALRQALETRRVRAGRLAPVHAATRVAPPGREGPVARRVAGWVPERPEDPVERAAAAGWAGPVTLVGLALAALGGSRPVWNEEFGCWVATGIRGPLAWLLRLAGHSANTTGRVVLSRHATVPDRLLAHEAGHVRQFERLGPLAIVLYLWWSLRFGYRHHPMERGAREAARRWSGAVGAAG